MTCEQCDHFREWLNSSPDDWRGFCAERHWDRDGDEPACRLFVGRDGRRDDAEWGTDERA